MEFCTLFSGSSGNAIYISSAHARILVDAGMPAATILRALESIGVAPHTLTGILVTHEHTDHTAGVGVMSRKLHLPVYANLKTWEAMESRAGAIAPGNARIFTTGRDFYIQDIGVRAFSVPHDAADAVGFALHAAGKKICIMTDLGQFSPRLLEEASSSDLILLESNHDLAMLQNGKYPSYLKRRIRSNKGHLSNDSASDAACRLLDRGVRRFILGHLSGENNREELALQTVCSALTGKGAQAGRDVYVAVAHRDRPGGLYTV